MFLALTATATLTAEQEEELERLRSGVKWVPALEDDHDASGGEDS